MILALWLIACIHVPAWQRSALEAPVMADPLDPCLAVFDGHVWDAREAMSGADAAEGASCGCQ